MSHAQSKSLMGERGRFRAHKHEAVSVDEALFKNIRERSASSSLSSSLLAKNNNGYNIININNNNIGNALVSPNQENQMPSGDWSDDLDNKGKYPGLFIKRIGHGKGFRES